MLPSVVPTGTSSPPCTTPLKIVPTGAPVLQAIKAWGVAALMFWICAETLTSVVLKCSDATILTSLFSGSATLALMPFSASCPLASVLVMTAMRVQPFSRK
jgi:hypothetical protein